ncbi:MAG: hypothetical protein KGP29_00170 [Proteobacteria bacterium]|nr:hypothetical protein [Pseudomonadota bacterium]
MTQILLLTLLLIPLLGCVVSGFKKENFFLKILEGVLPVLFLVNLIGLRQSLQISNNEAILFNFYLNRTSFIFLSLTNFLWLVFTFYSQRFWQINSEERSHQMRSFFSIIVATLTLICVSKNLMITLFFYSCLILATQLFVLRLLRYAEVGFLRFFNFLLYFESFFFFLAIVTTYKLLGRLDFLEGGIVSDNLGRDEEILLLIFYFFGLFFSAFLPYFLFFRKINFEPIATHLLFFLSYSLASLCIFIKVIDSIFGFDCFARIFAESDLGFIELIFLFNILAASLFLLFSKGIKLSFFYLFFQQFFFAIFAIFFFAIFNREIVYVSLISFSLSLTLIFFCVSNISTYLSKSGAKSLSGIFYKLPISATLLIFALVSLAGFFPAIGAVEKFFLIKAIWQKKMWISAVIVLVNSTTLLIFSLKILYHFFSNSEENVSEENAALARDIDFDSRLILTASVTALLMFAGLFVTKFI